MYVDYKLPKILNPSSHPPTPKNRTRRLWLKIGTENKLGIEITKIKVSRLYEGWGKGVVGGVIEKFKIDQSS